MLGSNVTSVTRMTGEPTNFPYREKSEINCHNCHSCHTPHIFNRDERRYNTKNMETQDILNKKVGTKEVEALKPEKVKLVGVSIKEVGEKKNEKVAVSIKHSQRDELIDISSVTYIIKGKVKSSGLWINLDEDGLIRKGSALAVFLSKAGVEALADLAGKEYDTCLDDKGYLTFKAY